MDRLVKTGIRLLVLTALSIAGLLHAQDFTVAIPQPSNTLNVVQPGTSVLGDWEVTVAFDSAHCAVICTYRSRRDPFGIKRLTHLLAPPALSVSVYRSLDEHLYTLTVDPARSASPHVLADEFLVTGDPGNTEKRLSVPAANTYELRHVPALSAFFRIDPRRYQMRAGPGTALSLRI